ncbi:hypothetical protein ACED47_23445 [Vibrio splendidus]|uniref:hypothetical protein n=1 Tax=Vibrio splendidus TaxID=29497 RepID=UPI00352EE2EC
MQRDCDLTNDLLDIFDVYAEQEHFKPTARRLHEELYLTLNFLYLPRVLKPDRLLAAALFAIHSHSKTTHYTDQTNKEQFLQSVLNLALEALNAPTTTVIELPEQLLTERSKPPQRLIQQISNGLIRNGEFKTKRQLNREIGLKGSELTKNRANTTSDLVIFLAYCQQQERQYTGLVEHVQQAILDNLSKYFKSHETQYRARARQIYSRF